MSMTDFDAYDGNLLISRLFSQHKLRLARVDRFLLTRVAWDSIGGLPGALLTISDAGVSSVQIAGPTNTLSMLEATRSFLQRYIFRFVFFVCSHEDQLSVFVCVRSAMSP